MQRRGIKISYVRDALDEGFDKLFISTLNGD